MRSPSVEPRPRVGVSSCLLGNEVRFDGGHKRERWVTDNLSPWVDWEVVCPEVAMGLGIPRDSVRLQESSVKGQVRLVRSHGHEDLTSKGRQTARRIIQALPHLDGFILKSRSPSCGLERVRVHRENGGVTQTGMGVFAVELKKEFPLLPMIEEGRLKDSVHRESFMIQIFAHARLTSLQPDVALIQKFHQSYKFILMAHNEVLMRSLGRIAANSKRKAASEVLEGYRKEFLQALSRPFDRKKQTNALQHVYGFVKEYLNSRERQSVARKIDQFREGRLPYLAVLTLIEHLVLQHQVSYIQNQRFFSPYPDELDLG